MNQAFLAFEDHVSPTTIKIRELTWWKRLLQLVCLLGVEDAKRIEVLGAADFELDHIPAPLDLHRPCILPSRSEKEILNLMNLLRLRDTENRQTVEKTRQISSSICNESIQADPFQNQQDKAFLLRCSMTPETLAQQ